jgi:hypothetical protein
MATESSLLTSLKARLVARTWTGGANVVFPTGCVAITANADVATQQALKTMRTPFALLQPLESTSDPEFDEAPNYAQLNIQVRIGVMVPGDAVGENPLMGANKTLGATYSEGRGLFEIEAEVFNAIGAVNGNESIVLQCRQKGAVQAQYLDSGTWIAWRDLVFEVMGTYV